MSWSRLSDVSRGILDKVDAPVIDMNPTRAILETGVPRQRRFLRMIDKSRSIVSWCWVDDDFTCLKMDGNRADRGRPPEEGVGTTLWHLYEIQPTWHGEIRPELGFRTLAVRCPSSLTTLEWGQVEKDDPRGTLQDTIRKQKTALFEEKRGRRPVSRDRKPDWDDEG